MKIPLLILCLANLIIVQAQEYISFPEANTSWKTKVINQMFYGGAEVETTIIEAATYTSGLTTLNATEYNTYITNHYIQRMYSTIGSLYSFPDEFINDTIYLREDNKTVYVYHPDSLAERILYNFNLNLGDTFFFDNSPNLYFNNQFSVVQEIDSIQIGDTYHKRFKLNTHYNIYYPDEYLYFIEGVGSNLGILYDRPSFGMSMVAAVIDFTCFNRSDTTFEINGSGLYEPNTSSCEAHLSVEEIDNQVDIFFDSQNNTIVIKSPDIESNTPYEIINTLGQRMSFGLTQSEINVSVLHPGTYIFRSNPQNKKIQFKFVVL